MSQPRRPSPTEARYRQVLAQRRSGERLRALAERFGLNHRTLSWWKWRIGVRDRDSSGRRLLPVRMEGSSASLAAAPLPPFVRAEPLEVVLCRSKHVVRVPAELEPARLAQLVEALEGLSG